MPVEEGQTLNASQSTPTLLKIAQLDTMTVEARISEADVINVRVGMPVYFTILGNSQRRFEDPCGPSSPPPTPSMTTTPPAAAATAAPSIITACSRCPTRTVSSGSA
jgi:macrolide-specific efflux system membrane fusion protein